jgi:hypothetical protein
VLFERKWRRKLNREVVHLPLVVFSLRLSWSVIKSSRAVKTSVRYPSRPSMPLSS